MGELIISRYVAELITTDAGRFGHVGLCQLHTKLRQRQRYVTKRREVAHEIRCCKNVWFQKKAEEVEAAVRKGRGAWKRLRELQQGRAGL